MTMDSFDPEELIDDYQNEQQRRSELAVQALQWFLDDENICQLYPREDVVENLAEELDIDIEEADTAISDTVEDIVDPVQQITKISEKYVGVIDYKVFNDCGAYGYIDFDDKLGKRKRVVCAKCVEENVYDQNIAHATEGEGTMSQNSSWSDLLNRVGNPEGDIYRVGDYTYKDTAEFTTIDGSSNKETITNVIFGTATEEGSVCFKVNTMYAAGTSTPNIQTLTYIMQYTDWENDNVKFNIEKSDGSDITGITADVRAYTLSNMF